MEEIKLTPDQITATIRAEKVRWQNRRKMAWTAMIAMVAQTLILLFAPVNLLTPEKISLIKEPLTWAYMCESTVILAYMGFTTWAYLKKN